MNARHARWIAIAALVLAPAVGFAQGAMNGSSASNASADKPAGTAAAPPTPILPRDADRNAHGIGSIDDVAGSMGDGSKTTVQPEGSKPVGTDELPPTLPRGTKPTSGIGNMEDATGSMQQPPRSSPQ
jgi:hypothetical protein